MRKRLGIFAMHDDNGEVKEYVSYLLREVKEMLSELVVVSNGELTENAKQELKKYTKLVFVREDQGYDATAFKEAQINYIGWEMINEYEELVLINDSCYGPIYPLKSIFKDMEKTPYDFWGMSEHKECPCPENIYGIKKMPRHIQPYFFVVKKNVFSSYCYRAFWEGLGEIATYVEAVVKYELRLTEYLENSGYRGGSYMNVMRKQDVEFPHIMLHPYECVKEYRMPFVKRKSFTIDEEEAWSFSSAEESKDTIDYITKYTKYDTNLIWKDLISRCEPKWLIDRLKMRYIVSDKAIKEDIVLAKKIGVFIYLDNEKDFLDYLEYIKAIPKEIDVYLLSTPEINSGIMQIKIKEENLRNVSMRKGSDIEEVGALFLKYEYICFIHNIINPEYSAGEQFFSYLTWENLLKNKKYIINVLQLMEKCPYLGLLIPALSYHVGENIVCSYEGQNVLKNAEELTQTVSLDDYVPRDFSLFSFGTSFWCRTDALKPLLSLEWMEQNTEIIKKYDMMPCTLEMMLAYVVKHQGYATGMIMTADFAAINYINLSNMLGSIINKEKEERWFATYQSGIGKAECYNFARIHEFFKTYNNIYIYGTGEYSRIVCAYLKDQLLDVKGFIVSDDYKTEDMYMGKIVYELFEIVPDENLGIIVALCSYNLEEVLPELLKRGFTNIYTGRDE